jgi:hypothetical protein
LLRAAAVAAVPTIILAEAAVRADIYLEIL